MAKEFKAAEQAIATAERKYLDALDALQAAIDGREGVKVILARKAAEAAEHTLLVAVEYAQSAHRRYWLAQAGAMVPGLRRAAADLRRYRAMMAAAGVREADRLLVDETNADSASFGVSAAVDETEVALEEPVSEVLRDYHGAWRAGMRWG